MSIFSKKIFVLAVATLSMGQLALAAPTPALAVAQCYCQVWNPPTTDLDKIDPKIYSDTKIFDAQCVPNITKRDDCVVGAPNIPANLTSQCDFYPSDAECSAQVARFNNDLKNEPLVLERQAALAAQTASHGTGLLAKVLPDCVFNTSVEGDCKDVSIFIKLAIDVANVLLSIIGGVALIAFLYGGFVLILSQGAEEKIASGKDAMVAALIGLAVVFGAYLIVNVLSDAVGLSSTFHLQ